MLIKVHKATRLAVALCDSDLVGKVFNEGKYQLDLTGTFFLGEEKDKEEISELLDFYRKEDACFNIVGEKSCGVALKIGLISEKGILRVDGVPFALVLG